MDSAPFVAHRPLLFSIAYRMLGSVADAEDLVQEAYLRWSRVDPGEIDSARAYLSTVITRLCIDHQRSARVRRERSGEPELPAPLPDDWCEERNLPMGLSDSLSVAFLVLLERLSPAERAAFLLRTVFEHDYDEISRILERSRAACRQLVRRARKRVEEGRPRYRATKDEARRAVELFEHCCSTGDAESLLEVLAPDVAVYADGGRSRPSFGRVRAITGPIVGAERAARFLVAASRQAPPSARSRLRSINAAPALLSYLDDELIGVLSFDVDGGRIRRVYIQADPDKLAHLTELRHR